MRIFKLIFLSVSRTAKKLYAADSIKKMASKFDSFITDSDIISFTGSSINNYVFLADEFPCQDKISLKLLVLLKHN